MSPVLRDGFNERDALRDRGAWGVSLSAPDVDDVLRPRSLLSAVEEDPCSSDCPAGLRFSASFRAIVRFLAAALALAACTRTARLVSLLTPDDVPASKGTKATVAGPGEIGSSRSKPGEGSGLWDTDLDDGSRRIRGRCIERLAKRCSSN